MEQQSSWPSAWVRASLELAILGCLQAQDLHGYGIAAELEAGGMGRLKGGSLYPTLARLEQDGHVAAVWLPGESGPGRKAYSLTPAGREQHQRLAEAWQGLTTTLMSLGEQPQNASKTGDSR